MLKRISKALLVASLLSAFVASGRALSTPSSAPLCVLYKGNCTDLGCAAQPWPPSVCNASCKCAPTG